MKLLPILFVFLLASCSSLPKGPIATWTMTTADGKHLLEKQAEIPVGTATQGAALIKLTDQSFQVVDGFGYTLTGGSAQLINALSSSKKSSLLQELFGKNDSSIGISYLRISVGASDLHAEAFSYDDVPAGQTDPELKAFSLEKDQAGGTGLIPLLKEILKINPAIQIMASPWSPPAWMKDNGQTKGGSLLPQYYSTYAAFLVKYIQAMQQEGITIHTLTPQNEPLHPGNNPSMYMKAEDQAVFVRDHLGPAFQKAGITTKIVVYDHNCNKPEYPITILNDPKAKAFVDGSAFHLYEGDISALSQVHDAHPDKNLYFTEQWTGSKGEFGGDLLWHIRHVIIGSMRNWSKIALEWNLANDPQFNPHTPGGCTECKGALTIDGDKVNRNVSYYIISHASTVVPPGSVRIGSDGNYAVGHVAFRRPDGKRAVLLVNDTDVEQLISLQAGIDQVFTLKLSGKAVASVVLPKL